MRCQTGRVLLGIDEYPFHQITDTFASVAGTDPSWSDGHYVCAADQAGTVALTSNVRLYQNNDVLDGFVCLRHDDRQYNIRVSRRLRPDMEHLGAGPLRLEIVEPLQTVRLVLDDNEFGIKLDLLCHTANVPYMGPIEVRQIDGRRLSERATYEITRRLRRAGLRSRGERIELARDTSLVLPQPFMGLSTAPRPPVQPRRTDTEQARAGHTAMGALPHARSRRVLLRRSQRT